MVQTVEKFTGVRVDHVAMVDFAGFKEIIDALGGVPDHLGEDLHLDPPAVPGPLQRQGPQKMDGDAALDYARRATQFADGDFARIRHQQQVIKAILDKVSSGGILTSPGKLNSFLQATSDSVSVDKDLSLLDMATELRGLRSGNLFFLTSPTKGTGRVGTESVVFADAGRVKSFYDSVRRDAVKEIISGGKR